MAFLGTAMDSYPILSASFFASAVEASAAFLIFVADASATFLIFEATTVVAGFAIFAIFPATAASLAFVGDGAFAS